jgi:hypothetical protein
MVGNSDTGRGHEPNKEERRGLGKEARAAQQAQAQRRKLLVQVGYVALSLVVVAALVYWFFLRPRPGVVVASQGQTHVPLNTPFEYSTNPPTSGPHADRPWDASINRDPVHEQYLIHSMEHGHVVVQYNCEIAARGARDEDASCAALATSLAQIARDERIWKLIVAPRPTLDHRIALTAWRRIDTFDSFDAGRIRAFIRAWRNKGPEATPN